MADDTRMLALLERKVLWLSQWMIHNANHVRPNDDGLKVGGHQASCASMAAIMTALYFHVLRPQDRVAVKPHGAPVFHAIQYLLGNQTRDNMENLRAFGGAQSYPSRTKDADDVDFSTGSVGMGVAMTLFASLAQDYILAHGWDMPAGKSPGRMVAVLGDAELDEGNIFEALLEGWKHQVRNTWWIVDYNRQSLDGVVTEDLKERIRGVFDTMGWQVVTVKYGAALRAAFERPGGAALKDWIDTCPNQLYSAMCFEGGAAWRERLNADLAGDANALDLVADHDDNALAALMTNLGGHDLPALLEAFASVDHDRPVCFIAYTVKGHGTPLQGHKDNHAGIMNDAQMEAFRDSMGVRPGHEWDPMEGLPADEVRAFLAGNAFNARGRRRYAAAPVSVPGALATPEIGTLSTQEGFGHLLQDIARGDSDLAARIVTTSPDVATSTNLGGWVNRRGLFAGRPLADTFKDRRIPSAQKWVRSPQGQHLELGIAENNMFTLLAALGLSHSLFGQRLIPIGTVYDPFIQRGLDALNYACYQSARFILVATPSGISLAPEGGAHQSIGTPLIGIAQDGLAAFEPAYVDELAAILSWSFDYLQRAGGDGGEKSWLRDETGGSVYLRLSTRKLEQIRRTVGDDLRRQIINGGYWLRPPGPGCEVVIAYQGAVAPQAIQAAGLVGEDRRDVGVLAITSADRLSAGWHAVRRARQRGDREAVSYVEELLAPLPRHAGLVTVIDGHPTTLSWLGGVYGHTVQPLGVEHFGQSGSVDDLYRHHRIDTAAIVDAAQAAIAGRPVRYASA
ncbi:MAG: transketolase [Hyphomicrobiales bacterium]|nr:transketolase [Hyphomicrobiales bacterium]MCP5370371.1 transketolase [Hyphomicrobiales bacterium]